VLPSHGAASRRDKIREPETREVQPTICNFVIVAGSYECPDIKRGSLCEILKNCIFAVAPRRCNVIRVFRKNRQGRGYERLLTWRPLGSWNTAVTILPIDSGGVERI
jgi:hypothetical protein